MKHVVKKYGKFVFLKILKTLLLLLTIVMTYAGILWFGQTWRVNDDFQMAKHSNAIEIVVRSNGVHTDLLMPYVAEGYDWRDFLPVPANVKAKKYLAIGWGSRGFYLETPTWADLKWQTAFKAAFGLDRSAIHIEWLEHLPKNGEYAQRYLITQAQYLALVASIQQSFLKESSQTAKLIPNASYDQNDAFYEAIGSYSLFHTCNTWANTQLKNSGLPSVAWTVLPDPVVHP